VMSNIIDISIIINNYNPFRLLQDCLDSIFNHSTGFIFEIIEIDNNSSEGIIEDVEDNETHKIIIHFYYSQRLINDFL